MEMVAIKNKLDQLWKCLKQFWVDCRYIVILFVLIGLNIIVWGTSSAIVIRCVTDNVKEEFYQEYHHALEENRNEIQRLNEQLEERQSKIAFLQGKIKELESNT